MVLILIGCVLLGLAIGRRLVGVGKPPETEHEARRRLLK